MAIAVQDINLAKRKVLNYLSAGTKGDPFAHEQFRALFSYLAQHGSNPDLQFVPFSDLGADTVIADAACKVYGVYMKKRATSTGCFVKAADHATSAGTTASDLVQELNASGQREVMIHRDGWAQGTGFTIGSDTTADGSTASTSGDGPDGFVLIGAP